mmetsp:Transcript_7953/g.14115  ORF Transcript_7953/g.14115 Transcript_7953/m.14115 type:complete len:121 (+) Transcript_7953:217-579(+)
MGFQTIQMDGVLARENPSLELRLHMATARNTIALSLVWFPEIYAELIFLIRAPDKYQPGPWLILAKTILCHNRFGCGYQANETVLRLFVIKIVGALKNPNNEEGDEKDADTHRDHNYANH